MELDSAHRTLFMEGSDDKEKINSVSECSFACDCFFNFSSDRFGLFAGNQSDPDAEEYAEKQSLTNNI